MANEAEKLQVLPHEENYEYYEEELKASLGERSGRLFLTLFTIIFFMAGSCMFAVGLFLNFHEDWDDFIGKMNFKLYYDSVRVVIFGASLLIFSCFVAWAGLYFWYLPMIIAYALVTVLSFITNLTGAVLVILNGLEQTFAFNFIGDTMKQLMYQYNSNMEAKTIIDMTQEYMGCCGAYLWQDWVEIHMPVPNTCRNQVTGNQYKNSCAEIVSRNLELITGVLGGVALWISFLQMLTFVFVTCIYRGTKRRRQWMEQIEQVETAYSSPQR